jgi:sterol desaturase/sphingolipid hydroxylase (fatty acid hydroxylase superfamily)
VVDVHRFSGEGTLSVVDLTVGAVPVYFGSIAAERWFLKRRAERDGPSTSDYERSDTIANLTMGTASLLVPLATAAIADRIAPQRSKVGKGLIALAAAAAVGTTIADRRLRKHPEDEQAHQVARLGGPTTVVAGGVALTTALASATRPKRMWERRRSGRDLGAGLGAAVATVFAWDFIYYWNHRLQHEARYLWAIHVVHHSSERYNLSTALRQPVADSLGTFVPNGALCLAGMRPALIEQARGLNLLYQFWIHTDVIKRLGWFEKVFNTPSHHRVHHGSNRRYIDRNHGSILIIWDRIFGTHQAEDPDEPVIYGLTKNIGTDDPRVIASHEYADILRDVADSTNWSDRLSFVARGPGWAYERRAEMDAATAESPKSAPSAA